MALDTVKLRSPPIDEGTALHGKSFVLDDDFLTSQDRVTVNLINVSRDDALYNLRQVLDRRGFMLRESGGVFTVSGAVDSSRHPDSLVYHPKHRSADYLRELAASILGYGGFSTDRPVSSGSGVSADSGSRNQAVTP